MRHVIALACLVALAAACRRTESPAPSPTATAAVAPTPAATATPAPGATATSTPAAAPSASPSPAATPDPRAALTDPAIATATAPDTYRVRFETTKGPFVVEVHRAWAPKGADRFYNLVRAGYYDDVAFFRVISNFMVQFGINGDPRVNDAWRDARISDDPVKQPNTRGMVTFATSGPDSRTTQVFINFKDNSRLDGMGFAPFGKVVQGMEVVDSLHSGYGEGAPRGMGPDQGRAQGEGNVYLRSSFPRLDFVKTARLAKRGA
jgi:peptidyl-prolyl cis-trans isomerase A (cyclophilin A)